MLAVHVGTAKCMVVDPAVAPLVDKGAFSKASKIEDMLGALHVATMLD